MKAANTQLKTVMKKELDIDEIDDLADDMAELMDDFNEINESLGRNFATPDGLDEADLEAELDLLEDELEEEAGLESEAAPSYLMPNTPTEELPSDKVDEYGLPASALTS